ncbi:hypothetical protein FOL47_008263 [Perkinsus chesapeaki]|uniref:Ubiquitin carboxyl-terminal hydrolase n=1 Tax=Perkinsus chesapeaki TaxID=330153 RepID=A0A7J6MU14_PERCH|nr:hypothetical protein FOL47_008263 [Perkinsus chesapeaki]
MELLLPRRIDFVRSSEQVSAKGLSGLDKKDADNAPQRPNKWVFREGALNEYQGWRTSKSYGAGLRNQGNTCYLNSVLQCLSYVSTFAQASEARIHEKTCARKRAGVWCGLCNLSRLICRIHQSHGGGGSCIIPTEILRHLNIYFARFRPGRQEDAHDALRQLIDTCIRSEALPPKISASAQNKKAPFVAPLVSQTTMLGQMFGYHTAQRITCANCGHVSSTFHFDLDISLPINRCRTLDECLSRYFAPEIFKEQNAYKCSKCKRNVTAKKTTRLYDAPMNLTLSFKRYGYGRFGGHRQKDGHFVKYDKELDLTKFITNKEDGSNTACKYLLSGVLVHSGATPNLGHYYAFVRNPAGFWYCCDDESVTPAKEHTVLSQQAYILFYERKRQQQQQQPTVAPAKVSVESVKNRKAAVPPPPPPSPLHHTSLFYTTITPDTPSTTASRGDVEDMASSSSSSQDKDKEDKDSPNSRLKRSALEEPGHEEEESRSPKKAKKEEAGGDKVQRTPCIDGVQESVLVRLHPPKFEAVATEDDSDDDDMVAPKDDVIEAEEPTKPLSEVVKRSVMSANVGMKAKERASLARSVRSQYGANKISSWDSDDDDDETEERKTEREQARNDAIIQAQRKLQPKIAMRDAHDREYDKGKNRHKVHKHQVDRAKSNDFAAAYKRAKARLHGPRNKQQMLRDRRMQQRCRRGGGGGIGHSQKKKTAAGPPPEKS